MNNFNTNILLISIATIANITLLEPSHSHATLTVSLVATCDAKTFKCDMRWVIRSLVRQFGIVLNRFANIRQVLADYNPGCVRRTENTNSRYLRRVVAGWILSFTLSFILKTFFISTRCYFRSQLNYTLRFLNPLHVSPLPF